MAFRREDDNALMVQSDHYMLHVGVLREAYVLYQLLN